jgi:hypothetical protein
MTGQQAFHNTWAQVVAKAWEDAAFKKRLLAEPGRVLKEEGMDIPGCVEPCVVENTDRLVHFILPSPPAEEELVDEQLMQVVGGALGCSVDDARHRFER